MTIDDFDLNRDIGQKVDACRDAFSEVGAKSIRCELSEDKTVSFEMFIKEGGKTVILRRHPLGFDIFKLVHSSNDVQKHLAAAIAYLTGGLE